MKQIMLLLLTLALYSCNSQSTHENVKLEILNQEVYFNQKMIQKDSVFYKYKDEANRKKGLNILTWRLVNDTKEKYLFIVDEDNIFENPFTSYGDFMIEINDVNNNKRLPRVSEIDFSKVVPEFKADSFNCFTYFDSIRNNNYSYKGKVDIPSRQEMYSKHAFVLHPGESKTFKTIINFPILREIEPNMLFNPIIYKSLQEGDSFQLLYKIKPGDVETCLFDYQTQDLKNNGIKIFTGVLKSNKVVLKKR